jgi:hypothetical protein
MSALKPGLAVLVVLLSLSGSAHAQRIGTGFATYPGAVANQGGYGQSYYGINGGFGNYGLPGAYPNYAGNGFSVYGPGSVVGGYFQPVNQPQTYNNLGGLMNSIKSQTGKPGSYRSNNSYGVSRIRQAR